MGDTSFTPENTKIQRSIENSCSYWEKHPQNGDVKLDYCSDKNGPYVVMKFSFTKIVTLKQEPCG